MLIRQFVIRSLDAAPFDGAGALPGAVSEQVLLFTGHMIDKPGRTDVRFPPELEAAVRGAILQAVQSEKHALKKPLMGIAGGACGGDILFHEICGDLGIRTELYLALPASQFVETSVAFAGPHWIDRFYKLYEKLPWHVMPPGLSLPAWERGIKTLSIWERANLWMLQTAVSTGGASASVIALWDGKTGDGPGGTKHMVDEAAARGARTAIIRLEKGRVGL